jgi:hypothetical protein
MSHEEYYTRSAPLVSGLREAVSVAEYATFEGFIHDWVGFEHHLNGALRLAAKELLFVFHATTSAQIRAPPHRVPVLGFSIRSRLFDAHAYPPSRV